MNNTLMSIQVIPQTPNGKDVIPYVDEAIQIIDASGLKHRVGALETTIEGEMSELLILIQKINERMVELEVPSIISQVKFYHVPEGISIETLTGKYDEDLH
ncbi:thiamine-binding protein [Staphylococcus sp. 11261D007BR]